MMLYKVLSSLLKRCLPVLCDIRKLDPVQVNVLMFLIAVAFNLVVAFTVSAGVLMWSAPYAPCWAAGWMHHFYPC